MAIELQRQDENLHDRCSDFPSSLGLMILICFSCVCLATCTNGAHAVFESKAANQTAQVEREAKTLCNLAYLCQQQSDFSQAEILLLNALKMQQKRLGTSHSDVATTLNNLAAIYQQQGLFDLAKDSFTECLRIKEKALGPNDPSVGIALNNLAQLHCALGKYRLAEPLMKRSLAILTKDYGASDSDVITMRNNYVYLQKKNWLARKQSISKKERG